MLPKSMCRDTLAYQLGMRPATQFRDMSAVSLKGVVQTLNHYMTVSDVYLSLGLEGVPYSEDCKGAPERDALVFYTLNHAVGLIRQKLHTFYPLGEYLPILTMYNSELALITVRMFYYLLLICARESRHVHSGSKIDIVYAQYTPLIADFTKSLKGQGSQQAADRLRDSPPKVSLGEYTRFLADCFNRGSFTHGWGGKAWGSIAEVLRDFVHGKLTAEMMVDTAFTLCHNGGPIFNKGMLYEHHTNEIKKILDVQRSGQIPQLVCSIEVPTAKQSRVKAVYRTCAEVLPGFTGYVDWFKVEDLGGLGTYQAEKKVQISKYGLPNASTEAPVQQGSKEVLDANKSAQAVAAAMEKVAIASGSTYKVLGTIEVFPNQTIAKIERIMS